MLKKKHIVFLALLLTGCAVTKPTEPTVIIRDSVRVEYRDRIIHDTAKFEIPVYVEKNVTRDTSSHLENPFAKSDAVVSDGFLTHSLETKPQTIYIPVEVAVTDTLIVEKEAQIVEKEVEVEKPLTWGQSFKIKAFWWLVAIALIGWRREILALVKWIIKLF